MCEILKKLEEVIHSRIREGNPNSYTYRLYSSGIHNLARKVGEEAIETAIAALAEDKQRLVAEAADLLYHLLVLLASRDTSLDDVCEELRRRMK